jgi:hypothetical protein
MPASPQAKHYHLSDGTTFLVCSIYTHYQQGRARVQFGVRILYQEINKRCLQNSAIQPTEVSL